MSNREKLPVAIHLLPSLDFMELVQFDEKSGEIEKASALPCVYDLASRQMMDRDAVADTIRDLYNMHRIPFTTPAVLILPSFLSREIDLQEEFKSSELRFVLTSEAERFYLFKKVEPHLDWFSLPDRRIFYSAFPKTEIEKYLKIFQDLKIPLVGIDLNYVCALRGLAATGAIAEEIESQSTWAMLNLSDNALFAGVYQGETLQKSTEIPLSIGIDADPVMAIQEIIPDLETFMEHEVLNRIVVVNNNRRVSSDDLISQVSFSGGGNLLLIDQNNTTLRSLGASEAPFPCSLEGIGGVFYNKLGDLPRLNFNLQTGESLADILHYQDTAFKGLIVANVLAVVLCAVMWGVVSLISWQKQEQQKGMASATAHTSLEITPKKIDEINRKKFIKQVLGQNVKLNTFLTSLVRVFPPQDVWLDKIEINLPSDTKPPEIQMEGKALKLEQVNQILPELNKTWPDVKLQVSNASPETTDDGQAYFTWSIQSDNMTTSEGGQAASPGGGSAVAH